MHESELAALHLISATNKTEASGVFKKSVVNQCDPPSMQGHGGVGGLSQQSVAGLTDIHTYGQRRVSS